jgi:N-acetylglucosamine-6-sulfatase
MPDSSITRREAARLLAGPAAAVAGMAAPPRPNIVFILTDDQRWDSMGCAGHPFLQTPHMDRLAREGALFRNAFVTTPLCSPSRGSFLTGQYVRAHGVRGNRGYNEHSHRLVTFPRLLHDAGYETAYVGKWHMGNDDTARPGFDRWVSFRGQGAYLNPALNIDGNRVTAEGYMTDILAEHAADFLMRKRSKPFALYLGHKAVHGPFTPAERHKDLYTSELLPRRPNGNDSLEGKPALRRDVGRAAAPRSGASHDTIARNQLRALRAVDDSLGRVLRALEETRQLDNTLVIFTSDNGYFWGEHGLGDKRWSYEESIRIPLLMRYPRLIRANSRIEQDALNVDIAPTVLELAGVPLPRQMHGRSLVPVFGGKAAEWRRDFLIEYFAEPNFPRTPTWEGLRTARWKYTRYPELEGMDELYDLAEDPIEMRNRIGDPRAATALKEMRELLASRRAAAAGQA